MRCWAARSALSLQSGRSMSLSRFSSRIFRTERLRLAVSFGPDIRVLSYALLLTLVTGTVFGLIPALQASRPDVNTALKQAGGLSGNTADGFLRHALVGTVQVAVSMMLLIAAGLVVARVVPGSDHRPRFRDEERRHRFPLISPRPRIRRYARRSLSAARQWNVWSALPGVLPVAPGREPRLSATIIAGLDVLAFPGKPGDYQLEFNNVSPEYFSLLGIPIVRGRNFTETEWRTGAPVALATESTTRQFWPDQDPIGKTVHMTGEGDFQVIGVVKDAQVSHLARSNETYLYLPAGPKEQIRLQLLLQGARGSAIAEKDIRAAIHALDPGLVVDVARLEDNLEFWRGPSRIVAILAGSLGALGMLLACVGVYGVVLVCGQPPSSGDRHSRMTPRRWVRAR